MFPRFSSRFVGVSCAVFAALAFGSVSHAQETAPPSPPVAAPPVVPPPPPAAPSASDVAKANTAFAKAMKDFEKAAAQMNQDLPKAFADLNKSLSGNGAQIRGFSVGAGAYNNLFGPRLPAQILSLNLKNTSVRDALTKVLDQAKLGYVLDDDIPQDKKITISVPDVQVSTALDLITQSAGVKWTTETRDGKTIVRVGKTVAARSIFSFSGANGFNGRIPATINGFANGSAKMLTLSKSVLPAAKVSVHAQDADARKTIEDLLKAQNIDYKIADDFPADAKVTISAENEDLSTVLDTLTKSAGVSWTAEKTGDKVTVLIGKTITVRTSSGFNGKGTEITFPSADRTPTLSTPLLYRYQTSEQRSTFTCPNCGKKTTIVQKAGTSETGDKSAEHDGWLYCPFCGKKVVMPKTPAPPAPPAVLSVSVFGSIAR